MVENKTQNTSIKTLLISSNEIEQLNLSKNNNIMGIIEFHNGKSQLENYIDKNIPHLEVHLPPFINDSLTEVWLSEKPVSYESGEHYRYALDGDYLFGACSFSEENKNLKDTSKCVYDNLFKDINSLNYPYLLRIWNYIPHITGEDINNLDRYKSFCTGRAISFDNNYNVNNGLPAATGIGTLSGKLNICFLASTNKNYFSLENPDQIPAYNYAVEDHLKPPYFSRALYQKSKRGGNSFYLSGTASIIGSESKYPDNAKLQCLTTIKNIEIILSEENLKRHNINESYTIKDFKFVKVYIRDKSDYSIIKETCDQVFSKATSMVFLSAQMCRAELLVEIEGII